MIIIGRPEPACPFQLHKKPANGLDSGEFLPKLAGRHKPRISRRAKKPVGNGTRLAKQLRRHIRVDNQAHLYTEQTAFFIKKELAVARRRIDGVAVSIQFEMVDHRPMFDALEVEQ